MQAYHNVVVVAKRPWEAYDTTTGVRLRALNRGPYAPYTMPDGLLDRVTDRHGTVFWYADEWNSNFGHFLVEQSHAVLQFEALTDKPELVHSDESYTRELLAMRGLKGTPLPLDGRVHFFETILLPGQICWYGSPIPEAVARFYAALRDGPPDGGPVVPRLLITRRDSARRVLTNEEELTERLERLGFFPYEFSRLSLAERIRLMRRSRCVFDYSGASPANHAWIRPGTLTITLYNPFLHGEEVSNSGLTRAMGGVAFALDQYGHPFTNQPNIGGAYGGDWTLPSTEAIASAVRARLVAAYACA